MGIRKKIVEKMETTTIAMKIQATKVVLLELVINATSLDISNQIDIRNIGKNKQILMRLVITATSLDISNNVAVRNKGTNKRI